MASERQMAANRANALASTGPKTPEGKENARENALRHGFRANHVVAIDERGDGFAAYHDELCAAFEPQDAYEAALVRRLAILSWRLDRVARLEAAKLNRDSTWNQGHGLPKDNIWPEILPDLARYESALDRGFKRAATLLERRQALRRLAAGAGAPAAATAALALPAERPAQILILPNEANLCGAAEPAGATVLLARDAARHQPGAAPIWR